MKRLLIFSIASVILLSSCFVSKSKTVRQNSPHEIFIIAMKRLHKMDIFGYKKETFEKAENEFIGSYKKAQTEKTYYAPAKYGLAYAAFLKGRFNFALEHINEAIDIDPSFTRAYILKTKILVKQGRENWYDAARETFAALNELEPPTVDVLFQKGLIFKYGEKYSTARIIFLKLSTNKSETARRAQKEVDEIKDLKARENTWITNLGHYKGYRYLTRDIFAKAVLTLETPFKKALKKAITFSNESIYTDEIADLYESPFAKECLSLAKSGWFEIEDLKYFYPNKKITRYDLAALISRVFKIKDVDIANDFVISDLAPEDPYYKKIKSLVSYNIFDLKNETYFHPHKTPSVLDFVLILEKIKNNDFIKN